MTLDQAYKLSRIVIGLAGLLVASTKLARQIRSENGAKRAIEDATVRQEQAKADILEAKARKAQG